MTEEANQPQDPYQIPLGLAFDDVLLIPQLSTIQSRAHVSTKTILAGDIEMEVPVISSNMDTVTMAQMAIAMAKIGGIGFIHRFLSIEKECKEVEKVKRYRSHIIENPYSIAPEETVHTAQQLMLKREVGGLMVTDPEGRLQGILTTRDVTFEDITRPVSEVMTPREKMVVGSPSTSPEEAQKLMHKARVEKLPLIQDEKVMGLIVMKDIRKLADNPKATLDSQGRLRVAASVGVVNEYLDRASELVQAGADALVVDVAHGHAEHAARAVRAIKERFSEIPLIAGNVATGEGVEYLARAGADAVRLGIGPGCLTAGSRILMANGLYKNIENVKVGDRVINKEGKPVKVLRSWCTGLRKVMTVQHSQWYKPLSLTEDHRMFVGDLNSVSSYTIQKNGYKRILENQMISNGEKQNRFGWKQMREVAQDVLTSPSHIDFEWNEAFEIDLSQYFRRESALKGYHNHIRPSYDLGYLFGTFLGDGNSHITPNRNSQAGNVTWSYGNQEKEIAEKTVAALENVTGKSAVLQSTKNMLKVIFYSLPWARLFAEFGKRNQKHLPSILLVQDRKYLQGLYDGLHDSDGHTSADRRETFDNTSPALMELWSVLTQQLYGSFPNMEIKAKEKDRAGGLKNCKWENCQEAYRARLNVSHIKRHVNAYQVIKVLQKTTQSKSEVPVYDLEVDCPTHSFIANNVIVHNSACTTRLVAGAGVPQLTALMESSHAGRKAGIQIIADGGIRASNPEKPGGADLAKAMGAGAHSVMLGSALAGTRESPGHVEDRGGQLVKTYRGMASMDAYLSKQVEEGRADEAAVEYVPEGITSVIPYRDQSASSVVHKLVGGLRSGMAYSNATSIDEFHKNARFIRQTAAGLGESRPHVLERR